MRTTERGEAPAKKKLKLSLRNVVDKENRWQVLDEMKEQALGTKLVPLNVTVRGFRSL